MSYNGWKNRQTWNVALWLGNDEGLYRAAIERVREGGKLNGRTAEDFVRDLMPNGTPDMDGKASGYRGVHWPSIAGCINEMAGD